MIESFLASWDLFGATYLVGLSIACMLALVGVWVVARDHIFLGAAVSQASTLGVATALWLGGSAVAQRLTWLESDATTALLAVSASVATAWLVARSGESQTESSEGVTGWVFLLAASLPVLMVAHSPHGLEEIQRLMFSTLLSATNFDLLFFLALVTATVAAVIALHPRMLLFAMDPEMAAAVGMRRSLWTGGTAVWLGVAVGLSIRTAGLLYTFGCLVLPALIAKSLCREVRSMLLVAPGVAIIAALFGFVIAHGFDLPPAHTTISLLCAGLPIAWATRWVRSSLETRIPVVSSSRTLSENRRPQE